MNLTRDTQLELLKELGLVSVRTLNALLGQGMHCMGDLLDYTAQGHSPRDIPHFGMKCQSETDRLMTLLGQEIAPDAPPEEEKPDVAATFHALLPVAQTLLRRRFDAMCGTQLSVRARHFLATFPDPLLTMLRMTDAPEKAYATLCPGQTLRKTLSLLYAFNQTLGNLFRQVRTLSEEGRDDELTDLLIQDAHPFLQPSERRFVAGFVAAHGRQPLFYILTRYITRSDRRGDVVFSLFHEHAETTTTKLKLLARRYDVTRTRIEQILERYTLPLHAAGLEQHDADAYATLRAQPYLAETSEAVRDIMLGEQVTASPRLLLALLSHVLGYPFLKVSRKYSYILARRDLCALCGKHQLVSRLSTIVNDRYKEDTTARIDDLLGDIPESLRTDMRRVLVFVARAIFEAQVSDDGTLRLQQNRVDVELELYKILQGEGRPMHIGELLEKFQEAYPDHRVSTVSQIRSALLKSKRIRPRGHSSVYGLTAWTDVYFGSIRDRLIEVLAAADRPLPLDLLTREVRRIYPDTTSASLQTSMNRDERERFRCFAGNFFGLTARTYAPAYQPMQPQRRLPFAERIRDFRLFVDTYKHLPFTFGGEREESLSRWYYNVLTGAIVLTDAQRSEFDQMIKDYRTRCYPANKTEYNFRCNCQDLREYVAGHHVLPTSSAAPELYAWLQRAKANYLGYDDQRYADFEALLRHTRSLGFNI